VQLARAVFKTKPLTFWSPVSVVCALGDDGALGGALRTHQHRVSAQGGVVLDQRDMADHTGQVNASPRQVAPPITAVFAFEQWPVVMRAVRPFLNSASPGA
jgi:hypothetical protein